VIRVRRETRYPRPEEMRMRSLIVLSILVLMKVEQVMIRRGGKRAGYS
jgi:hypothetical protein